MTENKRFTLTFDDKIVDNLTGIIHEVHSGYDVAMDLSGLLNDLNDENEQLKQQMRRLYNYFADWFDGRVPPSDFSEMWDFVKEDEKWD